MSDNTLFQRLRRLFSSNVVIRNVGGKIKVTDTERLQSFSDISTNFMKSRGMAYFHSTSARYGYDIMANISAQRVTIFRDYELMEQDTIVASVLDIYADESTVSNEFGEILSIKSDNEKVKDALHNLFYDILNIEFNLWPWIRNMCKYGDAFLKLEIADKYGVVNVIPISPYEIQREEGFDSENPYRVRFKLQQVGAALSELEMYEVAHFRLLSDTNFAPYGKSIIESARRIWKQIMLMEDAMMIHRIMRAPEKRIFKIDTGNIPPHEQETYLKNIISKIKKVPYVDPRTGDYNLKYNMQTMTEDFFIPVRGGDSGTSIDTLSGLEYNAIDDILYLQNKFLAAFKVPKSFIGFEEDLSGKSTLAAQDVRFARTIERVQRIFLSELKKIAIIHLYVQGFKDDEITDFDLSLCNPSTILEQERISIWKEKISLTKDMVDTKMFSKDWIYKYLWNLSETEVEDMNSKLLKDIKLMFRYSQIEEEGNDPFITGQTFGTAHDLAFLQQKYNEKSDGMEQKKIDFDDVQNNFKLKYDEKDTARDAENDYGEQNHARGRDPIGKDGINTAYNRYTKPSVPNRKSPLTMEIKKKIGLNLIKSDKTKEIIAESLSSKESKKTVDSDIGTFLDEKNLDIS